MSFARHKKQLGEEPDLELFRRAVALRCEISAEDLAFRLQIGVSWLIRYQNGGKCHNAGLELPSAQGQLGMIQRRVSDIRFLLFD